MSETPEVLKLRVTDPLRLPLPNEAVLLLPPSAKIYAVSGDATCSTVKVAHARGLDGAAIDEYCVLLSPDGVLEAARAHQRHVIEVRRHNETVVETAHRMAKRSMKEAVDAEFGEEDMPHAALRAVRRRRVRAADGFPGRAFIDEGDVALEAIAEDADW